MNEQSPIKKPTNVYLRYSGLGIQIAITIGLGVFIGIELDKWLKTPKPYFTIVFSFLFLVIGFYLGFKDLLKK
jgi:F0F1-type ATP synthase assembly protein I